MKLLRSLLFVAAIGASTSSRADLNIPSDGSDGALNITANTEIDLSQAVTGAWNAGNTANAGKGIYDASKWAVVFKYSSVTIAQGATVTFKNHPSRAPVVWLVDGNVTIAGTLSLSGQNAGYNAPALAEPGPGGFRGGQGYFTSGVGRGAGFGPGGGASSAQYSYGGGGSYGTLGVAGTTAYGNPSLLPLVGGSGGGGYYNDARGGGAGAGAILIASSGTANITGSIQANGGSDSGGAGGGAGGGIRLIASSLSGEGSIRCLGGAGGSNAGGLGRVRVERVTNTSNLQVVPDASVVTLQDNSTPQIWLPENGPTARIVSIGGIQAPSDPRASFGLHGPDATLSLVSTAQVIVETRNVEQQAQVKVRGTPRANGEYSERIASLQEVVDTEPLVIRWAADIPVSAGYSVVQVHVVRP